ncbi:FeoA domain protein [uncultured archaeon]|nr:FeoA domain protein [uncultured archaeon]
MPEFPLDPNKDEDIPSPPVCTPLSQLKEGEEAVVTGFIGGCAFTQRLTEMGLRRNAKIRVLVSHGGAVVIQTGNVKIAVGLNMARRILARR